jgi:hypothetical protein
VLLHKYSLPAETETVFSFLTVFMNGFRIHNELERLSTMKNSDKEFERLNTKLQIRAQRSNLIQGLSDFFFVPVVLINRVLTVSHTREKMKDGGCSAIHSKLRGCHDNRHRGRKAMSELKRKRRAKRKRRGICSRIPYNAAQIATRVPAK